MSYNHKKCQLDDSGLQRKDKEDLIYLDVFLTPYLLEHSIISLSRNLLGSTVRQICNLIPSCHLSCGYLIQPPPAYSPRTIRLWKITLLLCFDIFLQVRLELANLAALGRLVSFHILLKTEKNPSRITVSISQCTAGFVGLLEI